MRFAFVLPDLAGGGAEKAVCKLAGALSARGHRVELVLLGPRIEHRPPAGVEVHVLSLMGRPLPRGWLGKRLMAYALRRYFARTSPDSHASRTASAYPVPDLTVSTLPFADEVAALARLPRWSCRIADTLGADIARLPPRRRARLARRYRRIYGDGSLIAVSEGVAEDLRALLGPRLGRLEVIGNPFDRDAIRSAARQGTTEGPARGLPAEPYLIHVGRFARQKRHDLLLDAFALLPPPHRLVLLCRPEEALLRMIEQRGLRDRVDVAGFQPNPYPWIAGADLLVLCSDHEGLPNVLIEALMLGVGVVSTDCPSGPREILGDALASQLVPRGDRDALAAAMLRTLRDPPDWSRVDLDRHDSARIAQAYESLAQAGSAHDGRSG